MKVLVTGGAGYIGSHACVCLLERGHEVVVVDNLVNSSPKSLACVREITGRDVPFYQTDVCDTPALDAVFRQHAFDCVVHFAGLKAVGESVQVPLRYYENNLASTLSLLKVMASNGVTRIVFSSSATVYRSDAPMPVEKGAPLGCTNPYGWTKYMCEQILRDAAVADEALSVVLLRYFIPIGAHDSGIIGECPSGVPNNLLPYVSQTAIGLRDHVNVFGDDYDTPDGTGVRDYIHVMDLALGHVAAVEYAAGRTGCEAFNLGTGKGYSVLEIIRAFSHANGVPVPYKIVGRRPGDLGAVYSNPSKAARLLGWRAERGLEEMCRDAWKWQCSHPNGF